jgi:hypothetical protein
MINLTEKETKLFALALDKSVSDGEMQNAAIALIRSFRARGVTLTAEPARPQPQAVPVGPQYWPGWIHVGGGVHVWTSGGNWTR